LGAKCQFEDLYFEQGKIVFKKGFIQQPNQLEISFEQARFTPYLSLKKWEIGGDLKVEQLKLIHQKTEVATPPNFSSSSFSFIKTNFKINVEGGELALYDNRSEKSLSQHLKFDLAYSTQGKESSGALALDWGSNTPLFSTQFQKIHELPLQLFAHFDSHSFPAFAHLVQYFFEGSFPESLNYWDVIGGTIEGDVQIDFTQGLPQKIKGELCLSCIEGENAELEMSSSIDHIRCDLDVDFLDPSEINALFCLSGGCLSLQQAGELWDLKNMHSNICIKNGEIESSTLTGNFLGMEGELVLDWQSKDILMQMGFRGSSQEISSLLPDDFKEKFQEACIEDYFTLDASVKRYGRGLELEGVLSIAEEQTYELNFGCHLGCGVQNEITGAVVPDAVRYSLSGSVNTFLDHLMDQFCLSQKRFGWFRGSQFPLEKFFSPFLLHQVNIEATGCVDFEGSFDERYLVLLYAGEQLRVEGPSFSLTVDTVDDSLHAVHYFDLSNWNHIGFLPIQNGCYNQKKFDLWFENSTGIINFENELINMQDIDSTIDQIHLQGNVQLAIHSIRDLDLKISVDKVYGSLSDTQRFLSHFKKSALCELPFEGEVMGKENAAFFHYHFTPEAQLVAGLLEGELRLNHANPLFSLSDYQTSFAFDYIKNKFELKGGKGEVLSVKSPNPLILSTPEIVFSDIPDCLLNMSCQLSDQEQIILDITGESERGGETKTFVFTGSEKEEDFYLKVIQEGKKFTIDQASYRGWEGGGAVALDGLLLQMDQISCFSNPDLGVVFSGAYDLITKSVRGSVDQIKWDLANPFEKTIATWHPKGELTGSGTFEWEIGQRIDASLTASVSNFVFGGVDFCTDEQIQCVYSSGKGLCVEGLEVELPAANNSEKYKLGRFHYDLENQRIHCDAFDFSIPPEKLPWIKEIAQTLFPNSVHPKLLQLVETLKSNESLEGQVSMEVYPDNLWVYLQLKDGEYCLFDKTLNLKNLKLIYDPQEFNAWTQCQYLDQDYWLYLGTDSKTMSHGQLALSDQEILTVSPQEALISNWERDLEKGWCIRSIQGRCGGIGASLTPVEEEAFAFCGKLVLEPEKLHPWLQDKLLQYSLKGTYTFLGDFQFDKERVANSTFLGTVTGENCEVAQVGFDTLSSDLELNDSMLKLSNFEVRDLAGRLFINQAFYDYAKGDFGLDSLFLSSVRLARLKSPWTHWNPKNKPFYRFLCIPTFELKDFSGNFHNLDTVTGLGSISFTNIPRKNFFTNLLFIPSEITARIGLDFTALIPAQGTIHYGIEAQRVWLHEFKEMYSDGKHSRFYLAKGQPAYIDFAGHLNLKIKMKQYNLLMKLADFFTVSIEGTVSNPSYTLSNTHPSQ